MQQTTPDPGTPIFGELSQELGEPPEIDVHDFDAHGFQFPDFGANPPVDDTGSTGEDEAESASKAAPTGASAEEAGATATKTRSTRSRSSSGKSSGQASGQAKSSRSRSGQSKPRQARSGTAGQATSAKLSVAKQPEPEAGPDPGHSAADRSEPGHSAPDPGTKQDE